MLISQLEKFGFNKVGFNLNGEGVYIKNRHNIDYSDPYKSFPFINPDFESSGYLIINDTYHDTMFPYSELRNNTLQNAVAMNVSNGLSKIYVGAQYSKPPYGVGDPVLIYRKYTAGQGKRYRSCITSFCVVTKIIQAKENWTYLMPFETLLGKIGNKSVFNSEELRKRYISDRNVLVIEMLYYGYFGVGEAEIEDVLVGPPTEIWKKTKQGSGIPVSFFREYYKNKEVAVAYKLKNVKAYKEPKTLKDYGITHVPQSFIYLNES